MRPRKHIATEEITTNPIFLLQRRMVIPNQECLADYSEEHECFVNPDTKEPMDDDALLEFGWGTKIWITEKVFFTRQEGEDWGEANKHNLGNGRKGIDWIVYCIPCAGELAQILSVRPEILEFALKMESMMQEKAGERKKEAEHLGLEYTEDDWKIIPEEVLDLFTRERVEDFAQSLCVHPHDKSILKQTIDLAIHCMKLEFRTKAALEKKVQEEN